MISPLLLSIALAGDALAGYSLPAVKKTAACVSGVCADKREARSYRVAPTDGRRVTAKDRAFAADGSYCSVVGAKRCTSRGRRVFSTDFTE